MRIECPGCGAAYEVREELLPPGRLVRCTRCGRSWVPVGVATPSGEGPSPGEAPPAKDAPVRRGFLPLRVRARLAAPVAAEPAPPALVPVAAEPIERARAGSSPVAAPQIFPWNSPWVAWAASLLVVLAAVVALWLWRGEVMAAWPPAIRLFRAVGGA